MRFLIAALVLSCGLCMAEDLPQNANGIKTLTAKQAAELVAKFDGHLSLDDPTSIDEDVAQELAKVKRILRLDGLTSIDKYVAQELAKFKGLFLSLDGLTSSDKDVLKILKSNKSIVLPEKYSDKKD